MEKEKIEQLIIDEQIKIIELRGTIIRNYEKDFLDRVFFGLSRKQIQDIKLETSSCFSKIIAYKGLM